MAEPDYIALIQAELDGQLDPRERAELARRLLADPEAHALREDLQRLRVLLDGLEKVEPPAQLKANVISALPASAPPGVLGRWPAARWRYAAAIVFLTGASAVVYESVNGPGAASSELAGTMAARPQTLDTATLESDGVTGRVSLIRDATGLSLVFDLVSSAAVDVRVASGERTLEVRGMGGSGASGSRTVPLTGSLAAPGKVALTFFAQGREIARATLNSPDRP